MKKNLFLLLCLICEIGKAQYFQHHYGNTTSLEDNMQVISSTTSNGGYYLSGWHLNPSNNRSAINIVRTDNSGNIPGPTFFNNSYEIIDPVTGTNRTCYGGVIGEINNGGGSIEYAIAAISVEPTSGLSELMVMKISALGVVAFIRSYTFVSGGVNTCRRLTIMSNLDIVVTGQAGIGSSVGPYLFRINSSTGAVIWGKHYDNLSEGFDVIENPYASTSNPEILAVGAGTSNAAFLLKVNANTGATISCSTYAFAGSLFADAFYSIKKSNNPLVTTNDGFIIGAQLHDTYDTNIWTLLIDQNGNIIWSTDHDSYQADYDNYCSEIMERLNTSNNYEYYTVGSWGNGHSYIQVLKLDNNGVLLPNGEFWYGNGTDLVSGRSIIPSNTGGFTVSGTLSPSGSPTLTKQLLINAYFDGTTACDFSINSFTSNTNTPTSATPSLTEYDNTSDYDLDYLVTSLADTQICYATTISGGSNARSGKSPSNSPLEFKILGNGSKAFINSGEVELILVNNQEGSNLQVMVFDMMGRELPCKIEIVGNKANLTCSFTSKGIYHILVSNALSQVTKTYILE